MSHNDWEAMDLVGGKATEVANQLYQQYWDNKNQDCGRSQKKNCLRLRIIIEEDDAE